jgi:DNA-binding winged helix-turn-helix (wHTH) protein
MRVAFGKFVADTQAERLWKNGVEVRLREQPLQILFALLRNPGEVVPRETLRKQLWGNSTYVDFDNGLNTAISRLREMLEDDSANPVWIETVPKRGYRFIGSLPRPAAVAAYLKGHHVISPHTPESMQKSLAFFKEAMALDPLYPLAYHGAALTCILRCLLDDLRPREALPAADDYLQQGLKCPQREAMVFNTLAMLRTFERRWDEAEQASKEAVALEPDNPHVRMIRAQLLSCRGQHDEAVQQASAAVDLDPVHTRAHMHLTMCFYYARKWEACVRAGRAGLEVCPDPYIGIYTSLALLELGRPEEALQLNLQTRRSGDLQAVELAFNAYIAARSGVPEEAISALAFLKQRREDRYVPAITLCWLELALGRDDSAMDWLTKASRDAEPYLAWADVAPIYDYLRPILGHGGFNSYLSRD